MSEGDVFLDGRDEFVVLFERLGQIGDDTGGVVGQKVRSCGDIVAGAPRGVEVEMRR